MSPFQWRETPRQTTNNRNPHLTKLHNGLRTPDNHPQNITVTGMEQGRADWAKLQLTKGAAR